MRAALPDQDRFLVVAESFSGPIALRLAAAPPPGLAGVVLVASFARSPLRLPAGLVGPLLPALARLPTPSGLLVRTLLGDGAPAALGSALLAAVASVEPAVLAQRSASVLSVDERPAAACALVPMAYLQADADRVVPARCGEELALLVPGLERHRLPGPHLLLQREPRATAARILGFARAVLG